MKPVLVVVETKTPNKLNKSSRTKDPKILERKLKRTTAGYPWPQGRQGKYTGNWALLTFPDPQCRDHVAKIGSCIMGSKPMATE